MATVLIVDDHALMREGLRAILETAGHQVVGECDDPATALEQLARLAPDIVLLDLQLGGGQSGFDLLAAARDRPTDVRIIVLTMSLRPRDIADALRLGVQGYVLKGSPSSEMLRAVDAALQGRHYFGSDEADLALQGVYEVHGAHTSLSARDRQLLVMLARGESSEAMAQLLQLSPNTVDTYRRRLVRRLGLADEAELLRWAVREGLLTDRDT